MKNQVRRFTTQSIAFILTIALIGVVFLVEGVRRTLSNILGGSTFIIIGLLFILASILIAFGVATTRISRVEKVYHNPKALIGKKGLVKERIPAHGKGVVLVENELWSAVCEEEVPEGVFVTIVNIEGLTLRVRRS